MSENTTRKAVITTAQVQEALGLYNKTRESVGLSVLGTEFDKGNRGKGFALYNADGVAVTSYDTKEEAFVYFTRWVEVAQEILSGLAEKHADTEETPKEQGKATRKPAEKPAA